jgi:hypothetical protein
MSIEPWNGVINHGDYHYVKLTFTGATELAGVTSSGNERFCIRNPNTNTWVPINHTEEIVSGEYTAHYITETQPVGITNSQTYFITWQSLDTGFDEIQFNADLVAQGATVLDTCSTIEAPGTYYFPVYWDGNDKEWEMGSCSSILQSDPYNNTLAPCFSEKTMIKLLKKVGRQVPVVLVRSVRFDKKMYRINHPTMGELEFTADHPIVYRGKTYPFEELLKIHPKYKNNYEVIDEMDQSCSRHNYVYNFMIDPNHEKLDATIKLDNEMNVVGMTPFEHFGRKLSKKLELMCVLMDGEVKVDLTSHMSNDVNKFIKSKETDYVYLEM